MPAAVCTCGLGRVGVHCHCRQRSALVRERALQPGTAAGRVLRPGRGACALECALAGRRIGLLRGEPGPLDAGHLRSNVLTVTLSENGTAAPVFMSGAQEM